MRFISWQIHKCVFRALFVVPVILISGTAEASDVKCELAHATSAETGANWTFRIDLSCGDGGSGERTIAKGARLLVGLTLYAASAPEIGSRHAELDNWIGSKGTGHHKKKFSDFAAALDQKPPVSKKKRQALQDFSVTSNEGNAPFDIVAQSVIVPGGNGTVGLVFTVKSEKIAAYDAFLFAAWREADKSICDTKDKFSRSGCKEFGYVFGDDSGTFPFDAYPGLISLSNERGDEDMMWIVQRFR